MTLPVLPFVGATADNLRFFFDLLVGPTPASYGEAWPGLQSQYALRCLSAYGTAEDPVFTGVFIPVKRRQRLVIDANLPDIIELSGNHALAGFYPVKATSRGTESILETYSVIYEQRSSGTSLVFDLLTDANMSERLDELRGMLDRGNRTIYHIDVYLKGLRPTFVAVVGGAVGRAQSEPNIPTGITFMDEGGTGASDFFATKANQAMAAGWVRPEVVAPYPDWFSSEYEFRMLTLWTSSVFAPWTDPLDPDTFRGGVVVHASLDGTAALQARLSEVIADGLWPLHIGAKTEKFPSDMNPRDLFTLIASPARWDPLPRSFKQYDPAVVLPDVVLPEHRRARRGPFPPPTEKSPDTGDESPTREVPADSHDPDREAGAQRMRLLEDEVATLAHLGVPMSLEPEATRQVPQVVQVSPNQYGRSEDGRLSTSRPGIPEQYMPLATLRWALEGALRQGLRASGARLIQFCACKNGELRYARAITHAEEGYPYPSLFKKVPVGSVSKVLTTIALLAQIGTQGLEESIVDALQITPVTSPNEPLLRQTTLAFMLQHLSGWGGDKTNDHPPAWDDVAGILDAANLWQGDLKAGDLSRVLANATANLYVRAPGGAPPTYANRNFVALGEVVSQKRFSNPNNAMEALLATWSAVRAIPYEAQDIHPLQASWEQLVAQGDFVRHSRLPSITYVDNNNYRNGLYQTNGPWYVGAGSLVLSIVEVARIIASLGESSVLPHIIAPTDVASIWQYAANGLGFVVSGPATDAQGIAWTTLWHNGMAVGGCAQVLHRVSSVASYTVAYSMNMESAVQPDPNSLMDLVVAMDAAGILGDEDLFGFFG